MNYLMRLFLILVLLFNFSCKENKVLDVKNKPIEKANFLLGSWNNLSKKGDFYENWNKINDTVFSAKSFVLMQNDTVFYEKISLENKNDSLYYIVSVKNQNNNQPVSFVLIKSTKKELIFENKKHDFPSKISYKKITNDSIVATIEGKNNGIFSVEQFPMKK